MTDHQVVGRAEWQAAREKLLQREKEHTRMADELARERRELPWVAIEKQYRFDADDGTRTLAKLFRDRSLQRRAPGRCPDLPGAASGGTGGN
jgi:predicted dithiol-disulfide oxidoreductase (DUF899 family)